MFNKLKPLDKSYNFEMYKREHHKKMMDDKAKRVQRDVIYEFDTRYDGHISKYGAPKKTWVETYPWEEYKNGPSTQCTFVRVGGKYFIDQESFEINNPRNLNLNELTQELMDAALYKSPLIKFWERIFGKEEEKTWLQTERERVDILLKEGKEG